MTFTTTDLSPRIGTEVHTDLDTLLSGRHAHDLRALPYDYGSGRMLRRVTLIGEESVTATIKPSPAFAAAEGPTASFVIPAEAGISGGGETSERQ